VLVVDDSPTVRKIVALTLERSGCRAVVASNGIEALARIEEQVPDLILLDITMPHIDGYKLCGVIKENKATRDVPIVIMSGNDGFLDKIRGRLAGAEDYITKPVAPATLFAVVQKYLLQGHSA